MLSFELTMIKKDDDNDDSPIVPMQTMIGLSTEIDGQEYAKFKVFINLISSDRNDRDDLNKLADCLDNDNSIIKELLAKALYRKRVILNGYYLKQDDILEYIFKKYDIFLEVSKAIFIINGFGGSGKDTFINLVKDHKIADEEIVSISTIDPIRNILIDYGYDVTKKTEKDRLLLSSIKNAIMSYDPYYSMKVVLKEDYKPLNSIFAKVIFVHCREKKDIDMLKKLGAYTILIKNDKICSDFSNDSDKYVLDYDYDFVITNNGTLEELEQKAIDFNSTLIKTQLEYLIP